MTYHFLHSDEQSITLSLDYTDRAGRDSLTTTICPLELDITDCSDMAKAVDDALMALAESFPHELQSQWKAIRGYKTATKKALAAMKRILAEENPAPMPRNR